MDEITALPFDKLRASLKEWHLDEHGVKERMYRSATPRERERWHALWLLAQGWSANRVADVLERDPHTIGCWLASFRQAGPTGLTFEQTGGAPPRLSLGRRRS